MEATIYHKSYRIVGDAPDFKVLAEGDSITEALDKCPAARAYDPSAERWLQRWSNEKGEYVML